RHLHHALVAELLREVLHHVLAIVDLEARRTGSRARLVLHLDLLGLLFLAFRLLALFRLLLRLAFLAAALAFLRGGLRLLRLFRFAHTSTTSPFDLKKRTRRPSSSVRYPTRSAFFVAGLNSAT